MLSASRQATRDLVSAVRACLPLAGLLSAGEVKALFAPPTYDEKRAFAARHFTGGLPDSAVPVESLYATWSNGALPSPFSRCAGMYQGDSARYMKDLVERMGMDVPPQFAACPDHLALELDLAAVLLRSGARDAARQFLSERLAWLTAYRMRLLTLGAERGLLHRPGRRAGGHPNAAGIRRGCGRGSRGAQGRNRG